MRTAILTAALGLLVATALAVAAESPAERTVHVSSSGGGGPADGPSGRPALSPDGRFVAFHSAATNLTGDAASRTTDVYVRDLVTGRVDRVSLAPDGSPANGPSTAPAVAKDAGRIAFVSEATNLVPGDTNGHGDIFVRDGSGAIARASVSSAGAQANGPSRDVDISRDGRFVVFTSSASNLVDRDRNRTADVFVRDVALGRTELVSGRWQRPGNGRSGAPAISPDGRFVSFYSVADNLVDGDRNDVGDVFLADLSTGRIRLVSRSSSGRQQNASVAPPFPQVSDVSSHGRYVAFDSDAANLVRGDTNRDTDVFVRDMGVGATTRVSVATGGGQAGNDSFHPAIASDGRHVAFESMAGNLFPGDPRREDVFLHDRRLRATTIVNVGSTGAVRGPETVPQHLQRPSLSADADLVAFTTTADNLAARDRNGVEDVFVRRTTPALRATARVRGRAKPVVRLSSDEPAASVYLCRLDGRRARLCRERIELGRLGRGRHVLSVRAGGPGMRFSEHAARLVFRTRR